MVAVHSIARLEDMLRTLLKLRHLTLNFTVESHKLRLVSFNAAIASARLGEQGKMFATLTNEISDLTNELELLVQQICNRIKTLTCFMAKITNNTRNIQYTQNAIDNIDEGNISKTLLLNLRHKVEAENSNILSEFNDALALLKSSTNRLPDYIRFFSAVRIQLIVVTGSITSEQGGMQDKDAETLRLLANNITNSCEVMENVLKISESMLGRIQKTLGPIEHTPQKVAS